jgi:hypothetical protein
MLGPVLGNPLEQFLSAFYLGEISIAQTKSERLMA